MKLVYNLPGLLRDREAVRPLTKTCALARRWLKAIEAALAAAEGS